MLEQPCAGFDILLSSGMFQIPPVVGSAVYYDTEGAESKEVKQATLQFIAANAAIRKSKKRGKSNVMSILKHYRN